MSFLSFILALSTVCNPQTVDADVVKGKTGKKMAAWAEATISTGFRGSILVGHKGKVVAAFGVGMSDLEGRVPNDSMTLHETASVTKQFTATAILRLAQEGKLDLDAPISEYLVGVPDDCQAITVRHLVQHTSGIPRSNAQGSGDDLTPLLPMFFEGGPRQEPGTRFEYWNQGYAVLSEIIARTSGKDYVTFMKEEMFLPAGMKNTLFTGDLAPEGITAATGRTGHGEPRSALAHPYGSYGFQYRGMGGVVTTVWDFWRWDRALRADEVLERKWKKVLFDQGDFEYAMGWYVFKDDQGRTVYSHSGGVRGFSTYFYRYPDQDVCVVILANDDRTKPWQIAKGMTEILFKDKPTMETPPARLKESVAKALVGRYRETNGAEVEISYEEGVCRIDVHWASYRGISPVTHGTLGQGKEKKIFVYEWQHLNELEVERKGSRPVSGFRFRNMDFERIDPLGSSTPGGDSSFLLLDQDRF